MHFDEIVAAVKSGNTADLLRLVDRGCGHIEPISGVSSLMVALSYNGNAKVQLEFAQLLLNHPRNSCSITAVTNGHVGHLHKHLAVDESSWGRPYV